MPEIAWSAIPAVLSACFFVGFFPGAAIRLIVRLYPRGHLRRRELIAEVYVVDRRWRLVWVFEQLELGLFEGLRLRRRARKVKIVPRKKPPVLIGVMRGWVVGVGRLEWEILIKMGPDGKTRRTIKRIYPIPDEDRETPVS